METLHFGSDAVLWLALLVIAYFLRDLIETNKKQHESTNTALQVIASRIKSDEEILAVVNGKYISRNENALMIKEADGAHASIREKIQASESEIKTLREQWFGKISELLSKLSMQMERR